VKYHTGSDSLKSKENTFKIALVCHRFKGMDVIGDSLSHLIQHSENYVPVKF